MIKIVLIFFLYSGLSIGGGMDVSDAVNGQDTPQNKRNCEQNLLKLCNEYGMGDFVRQVTFKYDSYKNRLLCSGTCVDSRKRKGTPLDESSPNKIPRY